jgi:4-amino-4-deoxy-L-arabinose transferase-like glycosyltransferase
VLAKISRWWPEGLVVAVLAAYVVISASYLGVFPPVGEDEPWIAAAPHKLATEGVYGSDLFAGYYGVDRHNYQHMPVYPLLQAAVFAIAGTGVVQMRLLPVAFGFLLLIVVFLVGRQIAGSRVGAIAVILLVVLRIADGAGATGILLLDRARINRYDIAVPVFGLFAFWMWLRTGLTGSRVRHVLVGVLVGLASLSHLHGIFWLPALVAVLLVQHGLRAGRQPAIWLLVAGVALAWLPWLAYVASGWTDFRGQMRFVSPRFDLLNPGFYAGNVMDRAGPLSLGWLAAALADLSPGRIGAWAAVIGLPAAVIASAERWRRTHTADRTVGMAVALVVLVTSFIVLIHAKGYNYMIALWPVAALMLAAGVARLWDGGGMLGRAGLALVIGATVVEGLGRVSDTRALAAETTSYEWYTGEVARCIPRGSLVLGLQHYWLGLRQYPYRTWLVATNNAHPVYAEHPVPLDAAIESINPDVILIDRYMDTMLRNARNPSHPYHEYFLGFQAFVARRGAQVTCVIRDRTYGMMRVYRVPHIQ